jgi:glycosyltransferase involved in cell wall biosynthesis
VAKGIIPNADAIHFCYVHTPMRYAWNQYFNYFSKEKLGVFSRFFIPPVIHYLRMWDESSSHRVDYFIANSTAVAKRIWKYYRRKAEVIYPPVDTDFFIPGDMKDEYFLIVSALVPYKMIDLAVETFCQNKWPLKIVGQGPDFKKLKKKARANIQFLGSVTNQELLGLYQRSQALIMPGEEDFGINALESQACGIPVIAYGRGGATETVIPGKTGLFFHEFTKNSLSQTLKQFQKFHFEPNALRNHALQFGRDIFKDKIRSFIKDKIDLGKQQK